MHQDYATARMYAALYRARMAAFGRGYAALYRARMAAFGRGIDYSVVRDIAEAIGWASR